MGADDADKTSPPPASAEKPPEPLAPMEPSEPTPSSDAPSESYGLLGPVKVGPTFAIGLPHPMNYGLDLMYEGFLGFAFTTGKFEQEIDSTKIELANWDFKVRWHPWAGSFYAGAAYGKQKLLGRAEEDLKFEQGGLEIVVPTTAQVVVETTYLTPQIGWFAVWDSGFTLGFELGVQLALDSSTELDIGFDGVAKSQEAAIKESDDYKDLEKEVGDVGKQIGEATLPYLTLIRLGWLF